MPSHSWKRLAVCGALLLAAAACAGGNEVAKLEVTTDGVEVRATIDVRAGDELILREDFAYETGQPGKSSYVSSRCYAYVIEVTQDASKLGSLRCGAINTVGAYCTATSKGGGKQSGTNCALPCEPLRVPQAGKLSIALRRDRIDDCPIRLTSSAVRVRLKR